MLLDFDLGQRDGIDFMRVAAIGYEAGIAGDRRGGRDRRGEADQARHRRRISEARPSSRAGRRHSGVLAGKVWFEQNYLQKIVGRASEEEMPHTRKLTEREQQVLSRCI